MGKRSNFERKERDCYDTPHEAVIPLLKHLNPKTLFDEPCAGNGFLIRALQNEGHICVKASDTHPGDTKKMETIDVFNLKLTMAEYFITNPPCSRDILHPLIWHLSGMAPTWLLFDADWMHTKQSAGFMGRCRKIVSIGRVKWIPDSKHTGKDNCCWYLFDKYCGETEFFGRP